MPFGVIGVSAAEQSRHTSFWASFNALSHPEALVVITTSASIAENRNTITQVMLDKGADWVLYLDDDHVLPQNALLKLLEADKDVISAHYLQRQAPFNPVLMNAKLDSGACIQTQLSPKERGIVEKAATGAGCLLVKRHVIEALEPPYWTLGQIHPSSWGDDLDFCNRVRAAGFKVYCDLDLPIFHTMTGVVWPSWDDSIGWVANFARNAYDAPLARWPMQLPGD